MMCGVYYGYLNRWTYCCTWTLLGFYILFTMHVLTEGLVVVHGHY